MSDLESQMVGSLHPQHLFQFNTPLFYLSNEGASHPPAIGNVYNLVMVCSGSTAMALD